DALAMRVEREVVRDASFVTTSSDAIAAEYEHTLGIRPETIHNTFPLPAQQPSFQRRDAGRLRVYWFSRTVGPGRGMANAIGALGRAGIDSQLTLRGRPKPEYLQELVAPAAKQAPRLRLAHEPPAPPDAMVELAADHDVGLATESMIVPNRALCVSNKTFT